MDRYLALIATRADREARIEAEAGAVAARLSLQSLPLQPAMRLLVGADTHCLALGDGRGVIIGTLFGGTSPRPVARLAPDDEQRIAATRGQALIDELWGGYVALLPRRDRNEARARLDVLRDPSGALGCVIAEHDGLILIASSADLLAASRLTPVAIDWTGLADHLAYSQLRSPRTALAGVTELLAGMRWTSGSPPAGQHAAWSPWRFAAPAQMVRDPDEAARRLRRAVQHSVAAWGLASGPVLLSLSGGLDSSIVAAALSSAGAGFSCFSYRTTERSGDEREHARAVAARFGRSLTETVVTPEMVDIFRSAGGAQARPTLRAFSQAADRQLLALAAAQGARAFIGGGAGDHVFCYLHSARPLLDRIRLDRDPAAWWRTIGDIARLAQCSRAAVIAAAWARRGRAGQAYRWPPDRSWLAPDRADRPAFGHPWLAPPPHGLPGSLAHVANILQAQNHLDSARSASLPVLAPLMSQPVLEACLAIPSFLWCEGGRDRAVARRAYADILPASIVERRSKGTPNALVAALYERHRPAIRERLLDGALAGSGLIDRDALERAFAASPTAHGAAHQDLMRLLDVETWLDLWRPDAAPA